MKLAMIGCAGHWKYVINGLPLHKDVQLAGIAPGSADDSIQTLQKNAEEQGHTPRVFTDYRKMLDTLKPDIVAVDSFFHEHAGVALECIRRDCHVFCEKPVATTFADLKTLWDAYKKADIQFMAMFGIRYNPWFLTAFQAVKEGRIGEVRLLNAQKSYRLGSRPEQFKKRETYGGTIPWVGSHAIDWLRWFSGQEFQSVFASHSTQGNNDHGELENSALCHFTFSGEVFGSVNIDYLRPAQAPSHDDDRIRVAGSRGVIEVRHQRVYLMNDEQQGILELPLLPARESFADFVDQIKGQGECLVGPEEAFIITEACLKARQSADEKKLIAF